MKTYSNPVIITPKQLAVLQEIEKYQNSHGYSPTMEELATSLDISRPTVFEHIAAMREKNLVRNSNGKARSLLLTKQGEKLLNHIETQTSGQPDEELRDDAIMLRGYVSAGYGIEAVDNQETFGLPEVFGTPSDLYALRVKGKSMIDAGILDGDYIICKYSAVAENGQLVVALLEDSTATVKRFFKDKRNIRLMPENDSFEPIFAKDCRIQAVVIGLIRRF